MQKDFKIGLVCGLALVIAATLWLSTRPSLSIKARMRKPDFAISAYDYTHHKTTAPTYSHNTPSPQETAEQLSISPVESALDISRQNSSHDILPAPEITEQAEVHTLSEQQTTSEQQDVRIHIVRRGDTLSGISYEYYGSANKWRKIFDANRYLLKDPDKLMPEMRLIIPE